MKNNELSVVENLLGAYFHQDWGSLFENWRGCLFAAIESNSLIWEQQLQVQLETMLANLSDADIEAFFRQSHTDIDPIYDSGMNHRAWLQEVKRLIAEDIARRTAEF